jgi:sigma-B regulation protein RsbU (phosphoserine phosphatase)
VTSLTSPHAAGDAADRGSGGPSRLRLIASLLLTVAAGVLALLAATSLEALALRLSGGRLRAFEWLSEALLSASFVVMLFLWLRLRSSWEAFSRLQRAKVALDTQLEIAAGIQRHLLPPTPGDAAGCRWAARLEPASRVSGDYYDFVRLDDGSLLALIADISGHGMPAALLLSATHTLFRSAARESAEPHVLLRWLSEAIYADYGGLPYVTAILIRVSADGRQVQAANAGHPPGLLLGAAGVRRLDVGGTPAGLFPDSRFTHQTLELSAGDIGVLVTDGVSEPAEDTGGLEALALRAAETAGAPSDPARIADALLRLSRPAATPAGADDRTAVVFVADTRP